MEMPEGMNKLYEENHKLGACDLKLSLKVFNALNLMKEMAEALEFYAQFGEMEFGKTDEVNGVESRAIAVLKKFKEWK